MPTITISVQSPVVASPGTVQVTGTNTPLQFSLDASAKNALYRFTSLQDDEQLPVVITTMNGAPTNQFSAPTYSDNQCTVTITDSDNDGGTPANPVQYKYTIYLIGPNGMIHSDPIIQNEG